MYRLFGHRMQHLLKRPVEENEYKYQLTRINLLDFQRLFLDEIVYFQYSAKIVHDIEIIPIEV